MEGRCSHVINAMTVWPGPLPCMQSILPGAGCRGRVQILRAGSVTQRCSSPAGRRLRTELQRAPGGSCSALRRHSSEDRQGRRQNSQQSEQGRRQNSQQRAEQRSAAGRAEFCSQQRKQSPSRSVIMTNERCRQVLPTALLFNECTRLLYLPSQVICHERKKSIST